MYKVANMIAGGIAAALLVLFAGVFCVACGDNSSDTETTTVTEMTGSERPWLQAHN